MSWLRRRAIPTPPINTQETPAMTEAPPAPFPAEVVDIITRLSAVDPALLTQAFRDAALARAQRAAEIRELAEARAAIVAETAEAAASPSRLARCTELAARLAGCDLAIANLAPIPDDAGAANACRAMAAERIEDARSRIPNAPALSADLEMSAYRALPPNLQADVDVPVRSRADLNLSAAISAWTQRRNNLSDGLGEWLARAELPSSDTLDLLRVVPGYCTLAAELTRDHGALVAAVDTANRRREADGDEWQQVSPTNSVVASWTSDEIKALQAHRARMVAALAR
jgi:hypothetical protein